MRTSMTRMGCVLCLWLMAGVAQGGALPCRLDHVTRRGDDAVLHFPLEEGLRVYVKRVDRDISASNPVFYKQMNGQMHRLLLPHEVPEKDPSEIVLSPSDEAYIGFEVHSSCSVRPAYQDGVFGLMARFDVGLPGIPPSTSSRFYPFASGTDVMP